MFNTNSTSDFVSLVAKYNCFERESNISFIKIWHKVSEETFKHERYHRNEHYGGSYNEGLPKVVCNDIDIMVSLRHWPPVLEKVPDNIPEEGYVILKPDTKYPAFLTLIVPHRVDYSKESPGNHDIRYTFVKLDGQKVLSSSKMLAMNKDLGKRGTGPALTVTEPVNCNHHKTSLPVDYVPCLECPNWPPCASEFLTRDRHHGWPSKHLLDKIMKLGCHVVAIGRHDSPQKDKEWSWAFNMAEKELTYDVPDSIYRCMYLLRAIKNKHWNIEKQRGEPTIFSSYFIKTACLWICEDAPQNTEDILGLVEKIIDWLITCYKKKIMPHYFIPEANLLGRLKEDKKHFGQPMEWLEDTKKNLVDKIHTSIEFDENIDVVKQFLQHLKQSPNIPIPEKMMCQANHDLRRDGEAYSRKERHALAKLATEFCFEVQDKIEDEIEEIVTKKCPMIPLPQKTKLYVLSWIVDFVNFIYSYFNYTVEKAFLNVAVDTEFFNDAVKKVGEIFVPVQNSISNLVNPKYQSLVKMFIYREMGDVFHIIYYVLTKYKVTPKDPNQSAFYMSAIEYYKKAAEMYDKKDWTGIMEAAHLSVHYYAFKQWADLKVTLSSMEPWLMKAMGCDDTLKSLPYVRVDPDSPMANAGHHKGDAALFARKTFHRHPVFIGFHLLELIAEKDGKIEEKLKYREYKDNVDRRLASRDDCAKTKRLWAYMLLLFLFIFACSCVIYLFCIGYLPDIDSWSLFHHNEM